MTPIQTFLSDQRLTKLAELCKTSDSLLSLFDLLENQHSSLLAWCLSPNEGHGLGDSVIKDLLLAVSIAAEQHEALSGASQAFLGKWTPGRIRSTSFGSAFVARELGIQTSGDKGSRKGRLDLFLVDPVNRILVVVENKTGSALTADQLSRYEDAVRNDLKPLHAFQDFDCLLVVLDQLLDEVPSKAWVGVDYSFLEPTAAKAKAQVERGNTAAKLVLEYCQQHTDWESPEEDRIGELATSIALAYPNVVDNLKDLKRQSIKEWAAATLASDQGDLALFAKQYEEVVTRLIEKSGIAAIVSRVLSVVPNLIDGEFVEEGRTWANFTTKTLSAFQDDPEGYWPVYVNLYRHAELSAQGQDRFVARLGCDPSVLSGKTNKEEFVKALRKAFPSSRVKPDGGHAFTLLRKDMLAAEAINFVARELQLLDEFLSVASRTQQRDSTR